MPDLRENLAHDLAANGSVESGNGLSEGRQGLVQIVAGLGVIAPAMKRLSHLSLEHARSTGSHLSPKARA